MRYGHTMQYPSALGRMEILTHVATCMILDITGPSEISQSWTVSEGPHMGHLEERVRAKEVEGWVVSGCGGERECVFDEHRLA